MSLPVTIAPGDLGHAALHNNVNAAVNAIVFTVITAAEVYASPSGAPGVPSFRLLIASDIPVLTSAKISDFNAAADARIAAAVGVTVQPFDAATTVQGNTVTGTGGIVLANSPTIATPTIASFTNATHNHQNAAGGGSLDAAAIASGTIAQARTDYTPTVILTPSSSVRNVIQSSGNFVELELKQFAGQATSILTVNDSSDVPLMFVDQGNGLSVRKDSPTPARMFTLRNQDTTDGSGVQIVARGNTAGGTAYGQIQWSFKNSSPSSALTFQVKGNTGNLRDAVTIDGLNSDARVGIGLSVSSPVARLDVRPIASEKGIVIRANATTPGNVAEFQNSAGTPYVTVDSSGVLLADTDVKISTVGKGLYIKEGANATMGTGTLAGGTATINTTKVTANSRIFISDSGGTITNLGSHYVSARVAGTSFTVTSSNALDASNFVWMIIEPA